ncbi:MAG: hypothetical protein IT260_23455 [Saprospiraceae bacterium]|nr:hypothetical protein [Saprospiraceae bacterium]
MPRVLYLLLGPELLWVIFYSLATLLARANVPPTKEMDNFLVNTAFIVPLVLLPLSFGLFFWPGIERNWLLLRINLACLFGAHYVLEKTLGAHSEQGPGVGTAYIMGMLFVLIAMAVLSLALKIKFG